MEENNKEKEKIKKDILRRAIIGIIGLAVVIAVFGAGIFVGEMKAHFSYRWAENYQRNFAGPRSGFLAGMPTPFNPNGDFIGSHGIFGQIISAQGGSASGGKINSDLVIKGQNNVESVVIISTSTAIQKGRQTITKDDLKVGDNVTVIGSPNDQGQIDAKLIRVF